MIKGPKSLSNNGNRRHDSKNVSVQLYNRRHPSPYSVPLHLLCTCTVYHYYGMLRWQVKRKEGRSERRRKGERDANNNKSLSTTTPRVRHRDLVHSMTLVALYPASSLRDNPAKFEISASTQRAVNDEKQKHGKHTHTQIGILLQ